MKNEFPSLITPNAEAGLALAGEMANRLHAQLGKQDVKEQWLGGMNYLKSGSVSKEVTASILFYAIAAANQGWAGRD